MMSLVQPLRRLAFADPIRRPIRPRVAGIVFAAALLVSASIIFNFWPALIGAAALALCLLRYRESFPLVACSVFIISTMDVPGRELYTMIRWIMLAIAGFIAFLTWTMKRETRIRFEWFHLLALLLVAVAVASTAISINPLMTALKSAAFAAMLFYSWIGIRVTLENQEQRFLEVSTKIVESVVYLLFVVYVGFGYPLFLNPNTLGGVISVICWPLLILATLKSPARHAVPFALCGYLLYLSESRASYLAAFFAGCFILLALKRRLMLTTILIVVTAVLVAVAAYYPYIIENQIQNLVIKHTDTNGVMDTRVDLWAVGIANIKERPLFGGGFGVSVGRSENWQVSFSAEDVNREKGNSYLAIAEEIGLVGSILPLCLILVLLKRMWQVCFSPHIALITIAFGGVVIAGLINAFFEAWMFAAGSALGMFFWICAFLFHGLAGRREQSLIPELQLAAAAHVGGIRSQELVP
jgi:O-antigen ligase